MVEKNGKVRAQTPTTKELEEAACFFVSELFDVWCSNGMVHAGTKQVKE